MTAMQTALNKAGVSIPMNERIWNWLKDNPNSTGKKIAATLKMHENNVATLCRNMEKRGMVDVGSEMQRGKAGKGFTNREVMTYSTNPKMKAYELWPIKKKPEPKDGPMPAPEPKPLPTWTPESEVDGLSLSQCRQLYDYLKEMFNPKEK